MEIYRSYEQVQTDHPDLVPTLVRGIRKKRGKLRRTDPSTWKWYYLWGEGWPGGVFPDLYWMKAKEIQQLVLVALCGHSASWVSLTEIPTPVSQDYHRRNPGFIENR